MTDNNEIKARAKTIAAEIMAHKCKPRNFERVIAGYVAQELGLMQADIDHLKSKSPGYLAVAAVLDETCPEWPRHGDILTAICSLAADSAELAKLKAEPAKPASLFDWSQAPDWANVLLINKHDPAVTALAESLESGARALRLDSKANPCGFRLLPKVWKVIATRPETPK